MEKEGLQQSVVSPCKSTYDILHGSGVLGMECDNTERPRFGLLRELDLGKLDPNCPYSCTNGISEISRCDYGPLT